MTLHYSMRDFDKICKIKLQLFHVQKNQVRGKQLTGSSLDIIRA